MNRKLKFWMFYIGVTIGALALLFAPLCAFGQEVDTNAAPVVTAPLPTTQADVPYLNEILKWSDALYGLPALPLVLLGCLVVGYFIKTIPVVPNRWIPAGVFLFGIGANLTITPLDSKVDWMRAVILGMVAGACSIFIHRKFLYKWIDVKVFEDEPPNPPPSASRLSLWLLLGALALGTPLAFTACNTSQQRIAFNSIATVQTVAVGAYDGYVAQVIKGTIPTNDLPRVSQKFNVFQAATLVALDGVAYNTNALAPEYLTTISGDLLNLIQTLTPKKP